MCQTASQAPVLGSSWPAVCPTGRARCSAALCLGEVSVTACFSTRLPTLAIVLKKRSHAGGRAPTLLPSCWRVSMRPSTPPGTVDACWGEQEAAEAAPVLLR